MPVGREILFTLSVVTMSGLNSMQALIIGSAVCVYYLLLDHHLLKMEFYSTSALLWTSSTLYAY